MKKFLPVFIGVLMTLPVLGQKTARESQQAVQPHRQISAASPGKNNGYPVTTQHKQPFHFNLQHTPLEKNMRVLKQLMDSYVYQEFDASTNTWVNSSMNQFSYDGSGNNTSNIFNYWNPDTEVYEIVAKEEFTYSNGNLTEKAYFDWNAAENMYVPSYQWTFAYNGEGNITIGYTYFWNGSTWEVAAREERTYDVAGNRVLQIHSWWDSSGSEWNYSSMTENSYNGSGALLVSTASIWDLSSGGWLNSIMDEYTYNGSGQVITINTSFWNAVSSQWENSFKDDFTYDGNMNMVTFIESLWTDNLWVYSYKSEMAYNNVYSSNEIIMPWMFTAESGMLRLMPVHMLTGTTDYDYTDQSFVLTSRSQFKYSQVNLTSVAEPDARQARIYPQPATDRVTIDWDGNEPALELEIYDLNGSIVLTQQTYNHGIVNVDHLKPGLYFYCLLGTSQAVHAGKLSVR